MPKTDALSGDILLVDDMPEDLRVLSKLLSTKGHRVRAIGSGREALSAVLAKAPDLILLDIRLPDISGFEVCRLLKESAFTRNIPVIFISGLTGSTEKRLAFRGGAVDYITKPFENEEVLLRVQTHLTLRHLQTHVEEQKNELQHVNDTLKREMLEHERKTSALAENEVRYRELFENINSGVAVYRALDNGEDFLFIDLNKAGEKSTDDRRERVIGNRVTEMRPGIRDFGLLDVFRRVWATGKAEYFPMREYQDQAIKKWFENYVYRLPSGEIVAIFDDVTEQKQHEQAIAAERERLSVTLASIGDGVITTDTQGAIVLLNKTAEELCGWSQDEATGKPLTDVFTIINENSRKPQKNPVSRVLATGRIVELANHTVLISRDGTERIIADSAAPIKADDGSIIGVVLVFRNITEKQKLLETSQRNQRLESLGLLAGGIAHDFNNLMFGLYGFIDIAREEIAGTQARVYLDKAMQTLDRARGLTQQLLTFAKGGAPVKSVGRLFPFLKATAEFALSGSKVSCVFDVAEDLASCNFDQNQIGQVMDNLVINAQQAMPEGGIITIRAENFTLEERGFPSLPPGRYVHVSVSDQGMGIPASHLDHIFDPFFTTKASGHGLGLATCHSIISRHGGSIEVESVEGAGTTFHIYLPVTGDENAQPYKGERIRHRGSGTFIVMDDIEVVREAVGTMLEHLGYTVLKARNGEETLDLLKRERNAGRELAGIMIDLTVPGAKGGMEMIPQLRSNDPLLPVFVTSGYSDSPVMAYPHKHGFTASICKPFKMQELEELLNCHLASE